MARTLLKVFGSMTVAFAASHRPLAAQTLNDLIDGAKKESELSFVAGPTTFGGRQAFVELQAIFNKKFGL